MRQEEDYELNEDLEINIEDDQIEVTQNGELIYEDDYFENVVTSRNNYKSKISYAEEVNKPIMAIFFNFFKMSYSPLCWINQ